MQINLTQWAGVVAFVPAALAALATGIAAGDRRTQVVRTWWIIAAVQGLMAVEVIEMSRHRISHAVGDWLKAQGAYPERRPGQAALILALIVLALPLVRYIVLCASTRHLACVLGVTGALLTLFAVEAISLHAIDGFLYHNAGPILLIGWIWLVCGWTSATIAISAVRDRDITPR